MKKFVCCALCALPLLFFCGCNGKPDYFEYVSEYRKSVYVVNEDDFELKIYCTERETPHNLDGFKGEMNTVTEIFYKPLKPCDGAEIYIDGEGGEMNYTATTGSFYLSLSRETTASEVEARLVADGVEREIKLLSAAEEGAVSGKQALEYVTQYDYAAFEDLTDGGNFSGEISVRLLYDEGCFYYVGVCGRDKSVHSYLVDGTTGRILAEKKSGG